MHHRRRRLGFIATLLVCVVAPMTASCREGAEADGGASAPDDETVRDITLPAPDARLGSLDQTGTTLVAVGALALGSDGTVWATQAQIGEVLGVAGDGTVTGRLGGLGEGPGEFSSIDRIGWLGDTLWVSDPRNRRITFYGPDGMVVGTTPRPDATLQPDPERFPEIEAAEGMSVAFEGLIRAGALFVGGPGATDMMNADAPLAGVDPVFVTGREGGAGRIIATRSGTRSRVIVATVEGGRVIAVAIYRQPYGDGSLLAIAPGGDGLVVVDRPVQPNTTAPSYTLTRFDPQGDSLWSTRRPYHPVPADPVRQDSLVRALAEGGTATVDRIEERLFLPATLPAVSSVFVGRGGRIWVGRERPGGVPGGAWDVFSADGRLLWVVRGPNAAELRAADGQTVWGVEIDEYDVPYLVRYTVPTG